jgi:crotonobetainyl-CoA:carnitine CoA-transferase CaiB-like acyl-CoA transferase
MGRPELAADTRFVDAASRKRNEAEIDEIVSAWTRARDRDFIANMLVQEGIAAAPSRDADDLFHDPHLSARGALVEVDHPEVGVRRFAGAPWIMSGCDVEAVHAPLLGEHNDYVFRQLLGISEEELDGLQRDGVVQ